MVGVIFPLYSNSLAVNSPAAEHPVVSTSDTIGNFRRISKARRFYFRALSTNVLRDHARFFDRRIGRRRLRSGDSLLENTLDHDLSIAGRHWVSAANCHRSTDFNLA